MGTAVDMILEYLDPVNMHTIKSEDFTDSNMMRARITLSQIIMRLDKLQTKLHSNQSHLIGGLYRARQYHQPRTFNSVFSKVRDRVVMRDNRFQNQR